MAELQEAVKTEPATFAKAIDVFHQANHLYVDAVLSGLKEAWKQGKDIGSDDWQQIFQFHSADVTAYLNDLLFMPDAPDERDELPPGLTAWFAIEECVGETLDALSALSGETDGAVELVTGIHQAVRTWLSWELWAALLEPGRYSPDSLLQALLEEGLDVQQLPRSEPATPPRPGRTCEWRAFPPPGGEDNG